MIPNRPITDDEQRAILQEVMNQPGLTQKKLNDLMNKLNNHPRVELGGKTPAQEYEEVYGKKPPSQPGERQRRR